MVSRLLSLGATHHSISDNMGPLPLAAMKGFVGVVRILINDGMKAVLGTLELPMALYVAAGSGRERVVQLLVLGGGRGEV